MRSLLALTSALALLGCHVEVLPDAPAPDPAAERHFASPLAVSDGGRSFTEELADLDRDVAFHEARAADTPSAWGYKQAAAGALLGRARLSGSYDDYAAADDLLAAAFAQTDGVAGPWSTLASLQYSLHRFDLLPPSIDRIAEIGMPSTSRDADVALRRGSLDLAQGRYDQARSRFDEALALHDGIAARQTRAVWAWRTGDFAAAEAGFVDAAMGYHAPLQEPRAWSHLNLGLLDLDRGRYEEALSHYRDAEAELSGFWLVDEHIAEVLVLLGRTEEAEALYLDVIDRTDGPEFMDALADLATARGETEQAAEWRGMARSRWESLLARFPEAAAGHALAHYLDAGDQPERALELAEANHALRPEGEAKIALGEALLAMERANEARTFIEEALDSPYESAALHAVASQVYEALGMDAEAEAEAAAALAIDPHALD